MKRIVSAALAAILVLSFALAGTSAARDTNNFRISSYNIAYELIRTSENRSQLTTTEEITAEFPSTNQNRGLERALPTEYDGHSVGLQVTSVTNQDGKKLEYSTTDRSGISLLRVGDPDKYVHGTQTYRITYVQHDVTREFTNNNRSEWYWDTNGTEWRVPIDVLNVSLKIDESLVAAREGEAWCYAGTAGSSKTCVIENPTATTYAASATNVGIGENITLAIGFKPDTFAAYEMPLKQRLLEAWAIAQAITGPVALVLTIILIVIAAQRYYRTKETSPIVAEYIPPKDASVIIAAQSVSDKARSVFTAQIIDLAVRRYIAIIETKEKSTWTAAEYDIEIRKELTDLREEEKEIFTDMFDRLPNKGERISLKSLRKDMAYVHRTADNAAKIKRLVNDTYMLREQSPEISEYFFRWGKWTVVPGVLLISIPLLFVAFLAFMIGRFIKPLNKKGIALRRYTLGLDRYIKASEAQRLKFLQGPDTAEKVGYDIDTNDAGQLVKLYERTLPYAVLFGHEKQWAGRLGEYYQTTHSSPDWYTGMSVFNAVAFSSALTSFSQASAQAAGYTPGSSSSSGGSSGGGFSGGGGGGGGGGGW